MRELSLFTGAGGGLLGTKLLGWTHIGYVEYNEYCQRVIAQRIKDGILDKAPIFTDIREFIQSGAADQYRGIADVVTGGFPCQPFSIAGKGEGENDPRNMWPQTLDVIRRVRPKYCLLENVPGILIHEYSHKIFGDLAQSGFDVGWKVISSAEINGQTKRDRLWIVAHSKRSARIAGGDRSVLPQDNGIERSGGNKEIRGPNRELFKMGQKDYPVFNSRPPSPRDMRVVGDVAEVMDRLKAIGNGQVPAVVAAAWKTLTNELNRINKRINDYGYSRNKHE